MSAIGPICNLWLSYLKGQVVSHLPPILLYHCDHTIHYHFSDAHLRLSHLTQLVGMEESCMEVVELAELLLTLGWLECQSWFCLAEHML